MATVDSSGRLSLSRGKLLRARPNAGPLLDDGAKMTSDVLEGIPRAPDNAPNRNGRLETE